MPSGGSGSLVGQGAAAGGDIQPETGVLGTPVIDPSTNTFYVVSKSVIVSGPTFFQRLHAIDLTTGNEKSGTPVTIAAPIRNRRWRNHSHLQRTATESASGSCVGERHCLYRLGSHEDKTPYYGWIMGYNAATLAQTYALNITPNVGYGGSG